MSEENKIEESSQLADDSLLNSDGNISSNKTTIDTGEQQTINVKSQTEEMEVHQHTHTHGKKNWKTYLFEFFMLFLAVFCGFIAEYLLEHKIEKDREGQFITSLIADLEDDTLRISNQEKDVEKGIVLFDSLSILLESPQTAKQNAAAIYYTSRQGIRLTPLVNNTRTIDQLRNSGGFRLIRNQKTSDRIMSYYTSFPELRLVEDFFAKENTAFKEVASRMMNQAVYRKQILTDGTVARLQGDLALLSYDPVELNQLGFYAVQMNGSRRGILIRLREIRQSAIDLLKYLKSEYHRE